MKTSMNLFSRRIESRFFGNLRERPETIARAVLIAGPREPVIQLVEEGAECQFPTIASKRSPILKHRFASHSPYLEVDSLSAGLGTDVFSPPKTAVVGAKGEISAPRARCQFGYEGRFLLMVSSVTMNTGRAIGALGEIPVSAFWLSEALMPPRVLGRN